MGVDKRLLAWLEKSVAKYELDLVAVFRKHGTSASWPLKAKDADELERKLGEGGHFTPLPKEPAALANVLEVSLVDFLLEEASRTRGVEAQRGTERGYPDLEMSGNAFGGGHHAGELKMARRNKTGSATQSRITLYTGNTYFRYPQLQWPGTVFVDGCFWHRCPIHGTRPRPNSPYWAAKLDRNVARDKRNDSALQERGWRVIRIWEHDSPHPGAKSIADLLDQVRAPS